MKVLPTFCRQMSRIRFYTGSNVAMFSADRMSAAPSYRYCHIAFSIFELGLKSSLLRIPWFSVMKKLLIAGAAILIVLGALWLGRPFYRSYKEKRFVAQAEAFVQKSDPAKAALFVRQALQLNPTNPVSNRIMADLADHSNSPQVLGWRQRLVESEPTLENKIALGMASLRYENFPHPIADKLVRELADSAKTNSGYLWLAAELALKQGKFGDAEVRFREVLQFNPTNESAQVNLAVLQLQSRDPQKISDARAALEKLQASPENGLRALRSLVENSLKRNELEIAEGFSKKLLADSRSVFLDQAVHLTILARRKSSEFEPCLLSVKTQSATNPENIYKLVSWLNLNQLSDDALTWIQSLPAAIRAQQPVPMAEADCYSWKKDWRQLETFLNEQKWGDRDFLRAAMLSRALREQKQTMAAEVQWQKAIRLASEKVETLSLLVKMAVDWRWPGEAETVLWAVLEKYPGETWASQSLSQSYYSRGDTRGLQKLYSYLSENSADPGAENNFALVSLLLGLNTDKAHEMAESVFKKDPKNPSFLSTYAYSLHLKKKDAEAIQLFERLSAQELEDPSIAAYFGIVLAGAGQQEKAQKYLKLAERAQTLPEEKRLLVEAAKQ